MTPSNPHVESYDLVIKLKSEVTGRESWHWRGSPMAEIGPIQARLKRDVRMYGEKLIGHKIILQDLDQTTGIVAHSIVEEGYNT